MVWGGSCLWCFLVAFWLSFWLSFPMSFGCFLVAVNGFLACLGGFYCFKMAGVGSDGLLAFSGFCQKANLRCFVVLSLFCDC